MTEKNMPLMDHFNELRKRIISIFVVFVLSAAVMLFFTKNFYIWLVSDLGLSNKLAVLGPTDIVGVYFLIAGVTAIAVTIPFAAWQLWLFVAPALTEKERKLTLSYIPAIFLLFIAGIIFGYEIVFPNILHFLLGMNNGMFHMLFTTDRYFRFMINVVLPFGVLFELPVIVVFLTNLGILTPVLMKKMRRIAYFVLIVIGVVLSPPDFVSDTVMSIPLLLLYEICVTVAKVTYKRKAKKNR
ncbi:twin-arginine translocase subunit TatC [Sporolactobacillus shoreicorticis]|uniref:Sec-independent protein translocase protein TatC n=1 Tax=Sporolactobacillus shoreicorticis TaxID=1923877 RepID=A0ABW5S1Q8_9BACL|nr:twin-arginine translocase subunit TatC [Sporolactobacillus shoreicorticis]MCO7125065.1 twin-arginine translocase subunit TatC [Sporolactobacillus shoreicorticis]